MVAFQVEFLKTLEDGVRLIPDLEKLERVDQFKVSLLRFCFRIVSMWVTFGSITIIVRTAHFTPF